MISMTTFLLIINVMIMIIMTIFLSDYQGDDHDYYDNVPSDYQGDDHDHDQCKDDHDSEGEGPVGDQSAPTIASSAAAKNPDNPEK